MIFRKWIAEWRLRRALSLLYEVQRISTWVDIPYEDYSKITDSTINASIEILKLKNNIRYSRVNFKPENKISSFEDRVHKEVDERYTSLDQR